MVFYKVQYMLAGKIESEGGFRFIEMANKFAARIQSRGAKILAVTSYIEAR